MVKIPQPAKFLISSVFATIIDTLLFFILEKLFLQLALSNSTSIFLATLLARIVDTIVNFTVNKLWTFESRESKGTLKQSIFFIILTFVKIILSSSFVSMLTSIILLRNIPHVIVKLCVDALLFFLSWFVQKKWIFPEY